MRETGTETVPFRFPRALAWEVTRTCPLACRHCRAGAGARVFSGELSTDECRRVIDSLAPRGADDPPAPMVIWTGGEPMARADAVELVAHATARGVRSVMAPCGSLATADRLRAFRDAGVAACSFSLDGATDAAHDAFRGVPGACANVMRAMAAAREIGLPFQVNVTVSKLNFGDLDAIRARALAAGASKLDLFFLVPVGRGAEIADLALTADETRRVLDWAFGQDPSAVARRAELPVKATCCPQGPTGCLGGRGFAFLSHAGELRTCGFVETPLGNVREFACDFRALVAAARNPLGRTGNCRAEREDRA